VDRHASELEGLLKRKKPVDDLKAMLLLEAVLLVDVVATRVVCQLFESKLVVNIFQALVNLT
jgi:hypothetical protein